MVRSDHYSLALYRSVLLEDIDDRQNKAIFDLPGFTDLQKFK